MKFTLEITEFGHAAMADDPKLATSNLLNDVAAKISWGSQEGVLRDDNGNKVGEWGFTSSDQQAQQPSKIAQAATIIRSKNSGMFGDRESCAEAYEYALTTIPKEHHPAMTTALMVYHNTLLEGLAGELEDRLDG